MQRDSVSSSSSSTAGSSSKILRSTHGKGLLRELSSGPKHARLDFCIESVQKDPFAGRLQDSEHGNNSFHLVLSLGYGKDFMTTLLAVLIERCPEGLQRTNHRGYLPLHTYMVQDQLDIDIVNILLRAYPEAAGIPDGQGLIPLFPCVMRENANQEICKVLCKAFPDGPATKNKTHSYPLHFAAKRMNPNLEVLKILIRRNPSAASQINGFGLLPLHCICASAHNVEATKMIYNAHPDAIKVADRQGRLPLHLSVLAAGKKRTEAISKEMDELQMEAEKQNYKKHSNRNNGDEEDDADYYEDDVDEIDLDGLSLKDSNPVNSGSKVVRDLLDFLIQAYPAALITDNNFQSTPVDTVLEKTHSMATKKKIVSVFGLHDDPATARILLYAHKKCTFLKQLPSMRLRHERDLKELNWAARKLALIISFEGDERFLDVNAEANSKALGKKKGADKVKPVKQKQGVNGNEESKISKYNLLARMRYRGLTDLIRYTILFV